MSDQAEDYMCPHGFPERNWDCCRAERDIGAERLLPHYYDPNRYSERRDPLARGCCMWAEDHPVHQPPMSKD